MAENKEDFVPRVTFFGVTDPMALLINKIKLGSELTNDERNVFFVAYKKEIASRRNKISSIEQKTESSEEKQQMAKEKSSELAGEIRDLSNDFLDLLDKFLIPKVAPPESKIFYLKMKGDFNRYLAEHSTGNDIQFFFGKSQQSYEEVLDFAKANLQPSNLTRFSYTITVAMFHYEVRNSADTACQLAKQAFDDFFTNFDYANIPEMERMLELLKSQPVDLGLRLVTLIFEGFIWKELAMRGNIFAKEKSQKSYQDAFDIAKEKMQPTHPIRMWIGYEFSMFYLVIEGEGSMEKARQLAETTLNEAAAELETLNEKSYSHVLISLLRDNLALWTSDTTVADEAEGDGETGETGGN